MVTTTSALPGVGSRSGGVSTFSPAATAAAWMGATALHAKAMRPDDSAWSTACPSCTSTSCSIACSPSSPNDSTVLGFTTPLGPWLSNPGGSGTSRMPSTSRQ